MSNFAETILALEDQHNAELRRMATSERLPARQLRLALLAASACSLSIEIASKAAIKVGRIPTADPSDAPFGRCLAWLSLPLLTSFWKRLKEDGDDIGLSYWQRHFFSVY